MQSSYQLSMLRIRKSRFYHVPVIMRTIDILEYLKSCAHPLKANEISLATKIPRSTVYRILRTLVYRGYVLQDLEGRFAVGPFSTNGHANAKSAESKSQLNFTSPKTPITIALVIDMMQRLLEHLQEGDDDVSVRGGPEIDHETARERRPVAE